MNRKNSSIGRFIKKFDNNKVEPVKSTCKKKQIMIISKSIIDSFYYQSIICIICEHCNHRLS